MSDIQFVVGDKEDLTEKNEKLANIESIVRESDLSDEDLTLITQIIAAGAQDSLLDEDGENAQYSDNEE